MLITILILLHPALKFCKVPISDKTGPLAKTKKFFFKA